MQKTVNRPTVTIPPLGATAMSTATTWHEHHAVSTGPPQPCALAAPMHPIRRLAALSKRPDGIKLVNTLGAFLARLSGGEAVSVSACLHEVCDALARRFDRPDVPSLGCRIAGDHLPIGTVIVLGLVTGLLVSSAYAYGFAASKSGRIAVSFQRLESAFELTIDDSGRVTRATAARRADGLMIAALLVRQLGGQIEMPRVIGGSRCVISLPKHECSAALIEVSESTA